MQIINTTPHTINFIREDGTEFAVEPCGAVISATPVEETAGWFCRSCGAEREINLSDSRIINACDCKGSRENFQPAVRLVRTRFEPSAEAEKQLAASSAANPGAVIVGSIIAAQAFPGRVLAMTPAEGFERMPPPLTLTPTLCKLLETADERDAARQRMLNDEGVWKDKPVTANDKALYESRRFDLADDEYASAELWQIVDELRAALAAPSKKMNPKKFTTFA